METLHEQAVKLEDRTDPFPSLDRLKALVDDPYEIPHQLRVTANTASYQGYFAHTGELMKTAAKRLDDLTAALRAIVAALEKPDDAVRDKAVRLLELLKRVQSPQCTDRDVINWTDHVRDYSAPIAAALLRLEEALKETLDYCIGEWGADEEVCVKARAALDSLGEPAAEDK
jgi:hypothetical protein